ncbi:MAG: LysR substrate-binding domain-containing protein [Alphaproteobacteria bacterium]|nr:LysR substrate-binding domain-containing protein [Alphaproteobacteria bacterium]
MRKIEIIMTVDHARPTLRALQIFEAAARHGGFTAAAEELGITQSGVSRQISDLEAVLGIPLFVRNGARLSLTPPGERLGAQLGEALTRIWTSVTDTRRSEKVVTLSMLPSVATRWFAPRLGRFLTDHPGIDLRITASRHLVDFAGEGVDAAIRYSPRPSLGLEAVKLGTETVLPVCSPSYAQRLGLTAPKDLNRATLLYGDIPEDWASWFAAAGCEDPPPTGPRLGDDTAILQAALDHHGVALGRSRLVADDIAAGRLVIPVRVSLDASHAYWFVRPKSAAPTKAIEAIRAWLESEFAPDPFPEA